MKETVNLHINTMAISLYALMAIVSCMSLLSCSAHRSTATHQSYTSSDSLEQRLAIRETTTINSIADSTGCFRALLTGGMMDLSIMADAIITPDGALLVKPRIEKRQSLPDIDISETATKATGGVATTDTSITDTLSIDRNTSGITEATGSTSAEAIAPGRLVIIGCFGALLVIILIFMRRAGRK